jgi:hypothetical protein
MPFEIPSDLHPDLMPVVWLLGTWHGNGQGDYPTIEPFTYEQDVVFAHDTRPFLHYFSRTWITDEAGALETGFVRPAGDKQLELVLAHPTGYAEVWYGEVDGPRITLATDLVARTSSAREYTAGQRMYGLVEGDLMYAIDQAAEGQEMQSHLWGRLQRV